MNYSELFAYCKDGWIKVISRMLKNNDNVDILWDDRQLLQAASQSGSAAILNLLIDYYVAHIPEEPGFDEYLSSMSKLIEELNKAKQLSSSCSSDITNIFNKYIPADYEEESDNESDFVADDSAVEGEDSVPEETIKVIHQTNFIEE